MTEEQSFDVVVIGAGPGGYVAALRAAQLGRSVGIVEREFVGGTCLNVGCIPSKALLEATHLVSRIRSAETFGIRVGEPEVDFVQMQRHKAKVVKTLTTGVRGLLKRAGVTLVEGHARFLDLGVVEVESPDGGTTVLRGESAIIATGSSEAELPGAPFDGDVVISSRGALELSEVPDRLVVVGAGYIGLEMGSVYSRLGSEVVVLEMLDRVLPEMDAEISETAGALLGDQGLDIRLGARVTGIEAADGGARVGYEIDGEEHAVETDKVLVSIGRRPATGDLGLETVGIEPDAQGYIGVDHGLRTGAKGVYAIGDVVPTPMLAHVAMDEGVVAAECIAGRDAAMEYDAVPAVVYTHPELASVGLKEGEAEMQGLDVKVGRFSLRGNGRARTRAEVDGWVKVIANSESDVILGVHCVAPEAGHLIHEAVVAMGYRGYAEDLALSVHAHPTLSEAFKEAALAVDGRQLHM